MWLFSLSIFKVVVCVLTNDTNPIERTASLIVLPPLILGYDDLYDDPIDPPSKQPPQYITPRKISQTTTEESTTTEQYSTESPQPTSAEKIPVTDELPEKKNERFGEIEISSDSGERHGRMRKPPLHYRNPYYSSDSKNREKFYHRNERHVREYQGRGRGVSHVDELHKAGICPCQWNSLRRYLMHDHGDYE